MTPARLQGRAIRQAAVAQQIAALDLGHGQAVRNTQGAVGVPVGKASAWWQRDSIPAPYWRRVMDAAHEGGVSLTLDEMADAACTGVADGSGNSSPEAA